MKIIVIGGEGRVGRRIVQELSAVVGAEVTSADRTAPHDDTKRFLSLDLADQRALDEAVRAHQVVVNATGPFDVWGAKVLDAAVEAGVDYVDVCDDPAATSELLKRDEAARAAGTRAVIGLGASPGLTNYLGVIAARRLDDVDVVATFWGDCREGMDAQAAQAYAHQLSRAFAGGRAAFVHLILQASGQIPIWRDGRARNVPAWRESYRVRMSDGATGVYRLIGHPEPVTMPQTVPMKECINVGTVDAGTDALMVPLLDEVAAGRLSPEDAITRLAAEVAERPDSLVLPLQGPPLPRTIGAVACGTRDGRPHEVIALPGGPTDGSMSLETARPAVVGVAHIRQVQPGVHSPESAFEPEFFLTEYSRLYWDGVVPFTLDEQESGALTLVAGEAGR